MDSPSLGEGSQSRRIWQDAKLPGEGKSYSNSATPLKNIDPILKFQDEIDKIPS
jgi:hypothetical protein